MWKAPPRNLDWDNRVLALYNIWKKLGSVPPTCSVLYPGAGYDLFHPLLATCAFDFHFVDEKFSGAEKIAEVYRERIKEFFKGESQNLGSCIRTLFAEEEAYLTKYRFGRYKFKVSIPFETELWVLYYGMPYDVFLESSLRKLYMAGVVKVLFEKESWIVPDHPAALAQFIDRLVLDGFVISGLDFSVGGLANTMMLAFGLESVTYEKCGTIVGYETLNIFRKVRERSLDVYGKMAEDFISAEAMVKNVRANILTDAYGSSQTALARGISALADVREQLDARENDACEEAFVRDIVHIARAVCKNNPVSRID